MTISTLKPFAFRLAQPASAMAWIAIGDHDLGAGLGQRFRAGKPNALAAAGHNGRLAVEPEFFQIHLSSSFAHSGGIGESRAVGRADSAHVLMAPPSLSKRWMRRGIRRQPHVVAGMETELADAARRQRAELAGIDIEEGVAAEMLGDRYGSRPASALAVDLQMLGPDADGGDAGLAAGSPGTKFILGEPMKPATKRFAGRS